MPLSSQNLSKLRVAFAKVRTKHGDDTARQLLIDCGVPEGLLTECSDENAMAVIAELEAGFQSDKPHMRASKPKPKPVPKSLEEIRSELMAKVPAVYDRWNKRV
jgi:hypothetical protein